MLKVRRAELAWLLPTSVRRDLLAQHLENHAEHRNHEEFPPKGECRICDRQEPTSRFEPFKPSDAQVEAPAYRQVPGKDAMRHDDQGEPAEYNENVIENADMNADYVASINPDE